MVVVVVCVCTAQIHSGLVSKSVWAGSFTAPESAAAAAASTNGGSGSGSDTPAVGDTGLSWRIDIKSASKKQAAINEPTAILQLSYHKDGCATSAAAAKTPEVVRFEMDRSAVSDVITKLNAIEQLIQKLA